MTEINDIHNVLHKYFALSVQKANHSKSCIFYSPMHSPNANTQIQNCMHIVGMVRGVKYLGQNLLMHKSKKREFKNILDKLSSKTKIWKVIILSKTGKSIYIRLVL